MKPFRKFKNFQLRWKEPMGRPECPYLYRWTLLFFGFSIRLHHWIRSDDKRHFHDHPFDFVSIVLKGFYTNVYIDNTDYQAIVMKAPVKAFSWWKAKATTRHYLDIPKGGAWTLLFCSRPYRKWGFYVHNHLWRPLRYFHKFGIPPCDFQ